MPKSVHLKASKIVVISQIGELECKRIKQMKNPHKYFPMLKDFKISNKTV